MFIVQVFLEHIKHYLPQSQQKLQKNESPWYIRYYASSTSVEIVCSSATTYSAPVCLQFPSTNTRLGKTVPDVQIKRERSLASLRGTLKTLCQSYQLKLKKKMIWVRSSASGLAVVSAIQRLMEREKQNVMSGQGQEITVVNNSNYELKQQNVSEDYGREY